MRCCKVLVCPYFAHVAALTRLLQSGCSIADDGACALADMLRFNTALTELDLVGVVCLEDWVFLCSWCACVWLLCVQRRNPISKSGVAALNEALQSNKILKLLHVSGFVIAFLHGLCFGNKIHPYNECTSIDFSLKVMYWNEFCIHICFSQSNCIVSRNFKTKNSHFHRPPLETSRNLNGLHFVVLTLLIWLKP